MTLCGRSLLLGQCGTYFCTGASSAGSVVYGIPKDDIDGTLLATAVCGSDHVPALTTLVSPRRGFGKMQLLQIRGGGSNAVLSGKVA